MPQTTSLGEFIRARRERLRPEQVGLTRGFRRRAKGLRREELAGLSGISPTWLTWIEQGRTESVSAGTVTRIARALLLSRAERSYIFELAGIRDPEKPILASDPHLRELLKKTVSTIQAAAYVLDYAWNAVVWNRRAARLFTEWLGNPSGERNLLHYMFLNPEARGFIVDWPARGQRLVSEFRRDCSTFLDSPEIANQVEKLRRESPEFESFWSTQNVLEREGGERSFLHPQDGRICFRQVTLSPALAPGMKLIILL